MRRANCVERPQLVKDGVRDFVGTHLYKPSTKTREIGKARVGTHGDAKALCQLYSVGHNLWVSCVSTTGHISRSDIRHNGFVISHCPEAETLPHIAVQINYFHERLRRT